MNFLAYLVHADTTFFVSACVGFGIVWSLTHYKDQLALLLFGLSGILTLHSGIRLLVPALKEWARTYSAWASCLYWSEILQAIDRTLLFLALTLIAHLAFLFWVPPTRRLVCVQSIYVLFFSFSTTWIDILPTDRSLLLLRETKLGLYIPWLLPFYGCCLLPLVFGLERLSRLLPSVLSTPEDPKNKTVQHNTRLSPFAQKNTPDKPIPRGPFGQSLSWLYVGFWIIYFTLWVDLLAALMGKQWEYSALEGGWFLFLFMAGCTYVFRGVSLLDSLKSTKNIFFKQIQERKKDTAKIASLQESFSRMTQTSYPMEVLASLIIKETSMPLEHMARALLHLREMGLSHEERERDLVLLEEHKNNLCKSLADFSFFTLPVQGRFVPLSLPNLVAQLVRGWTKLPALQLDTKHCDASTPHIQGDPKLLQRLFSHLFAALQGTLRSDHVLCIAVERTSSPQEEGISVTISPKCLSGMDRASLSKGYSQYHFANKSLDTMIVQKIIDAHNAFCSFEQSVEGETACTLFFPFSARPSEEEDLHTNLLPLVYGNPL